MLKFKRTRNLVFLNSIWLENVLFSESNLKFFIRKFHIYLNKKPGLGFCLGLSCDLCPGCQRMWDAKLADEQNVLKLAQEPRTKKHDSNLESYLIVFLNLIFQKSNDCISVLIDIFENHDFQSWKNYNVVARQPLS